MEEAALASVDRNRRALNDAMDQGTQIYGITTGYGALVTRQVPPERSREAQVNLLRSHAAGWGDPLPREVVRAAMIVRLNGLLQARSGVRREVLERIVAFLNAGLIPLIPRAGSLGASGDLAPSAHAFLPLIGEGQVVDEAGELLGGTEALNRLGVPPLVLEAKEALSLINGTHFMAAIAALVSARVATALDTADAAAALSLEALAGSASALDPRVHTLRRLSGQMRSAENMRGLIKGSHSPSDEAGELQDAYSLRCAPQIHGAAREAVAYFDRIVDADLNAVTDNPVVFEEPPYVMSAGNFHGQSLALALDTLRVAMADLASVSERRTFRLLSPSLNNGLPPFLSLEAGASSGYMVAQYTAAALLVELRALAHPVSCDGVPTSDSQEDHVSMGMTGATMALDAIDRLETVLAIELVCSAQAVDCRDREPNGGVAAVHRLVREQVPPLESDRPPAADIVAAQQIVTEGRVAAIVAQSNRSTSLVR
ncbi:MAG: HAL/PAL/TAL family ammonia-lyase [Solirubrobacterales bacterium]